MSIQTAKTKLTVAEYHQLGKDGYFKPEDRVELIDGEVIYMSPIGGEHAWIVNRLNMILAPALAARATVSVQNPVVLSDDTEPQPDVLVHRQRKRTHPQPEHALLLIEVSDSTLAFDRNIKLRRYAETGVPEVWIVNIPEQVVEQYYGPQPGQYETRFVHTVGGEVQSTLLAEARVRVADLFEVPAE